MGQEESKGMPARIFIETNEMMVTAGQFVTGFVYLIVYQNCSFHTVDLTLVGEEYCYWQERRGSGKDQKIFIFRNQKQTMRDSKQIAIFDDGIVPRGQYLFPFKLLLPSQLPGSYYESPNMYIRYTLTAELSNQNCQNVVDIEHSTVINVYQPLREVPCPLIGSVYANPQCCWCCIDYGNVIVKLGCDRREVTSGEEINGTILIDNSQGKRPVSDGVVSFVDRKWKISDAGQVRQEVVVDQPLYVIPEDVMAGEKKIFNFKAKIPTGLKFSTAIGSIVARYQLLKFSSTMGFCSDAPTVSQLLVFHTTTPQIQIPSKCPKLPGWNPIISNEMAITDLEMFSYRPHSQMPYLNRKSKNLQPNQCMFLYQIISSKQLLKAMDQPKTVSVANLNQTPNIALSTSNQELHIQPNPQQ